MHYEFDDLYKGLYYSDPPVFVTVDALLHIYHLVFD